MDTNFDYNATFKAISVKLKKRFLRKPNVSDAIEEYTSLSKQLENEECYGMSGYCMQQVAKSYQSVGNTAAKSSALQTAAKQYLTSEIVSTIELCSLTFNEDLLTAISIYEECIRLHMEQNEKHLAAKICSELADIMAQKFDKFFEAIPYYERAINLYSQINAPEQPTSLQILFPLFKLAALKVFTCDYSGALNSYTEICNLISSKCQQPSIANAINSKQFPTPLSKPDSLTASSGNHAFIKPIGIYSDFLVEADISKLILLLYLKPTKMKPEQTDTIEVYSWFQSVSNQSNTNYLPVACMDKDLFILLQSFVMACQSNDSQVIYTLQTELWPYLNETQNSIIDLITDQFVNSTYTDDLLSQ